MLGNGDAADGAFYNFEGVIQQPADCLKDPAGFSQHLGSDAVSRQQGNSCFHAGPAAASEILWRAVSTIWRRSLSSIFFFRSASAVIKPYAHSVSSAVSLSPRT